MPTQYPYPENDWAVGSMRKTAKAARGEANIGEAAGRLSDHPVVEAMSRMHKGQQKAQGIKEYQALTPEQWANWQQQFPMAQIIDSENPQIAELSKTHDFYTIPNQYEKFLFMNPRQQEQGPGPERAE